MSAQKQLHADANLQGFRLIRRICRSTLSRTRAATLQRKHGLEDWRVGGIPRHSQITDDLLEGHIAMRQRSLYSCLRATQQRCEGLHACRGGKKMSFPLMLSLASMLEQLQCTRGAVKDNIYSMKRMSGAWSERRAQHT